MPAAPKKKYYKKKTTTMAAKPVTRKRAPNYVRQARRSYKGADTGIQYDYPGVGARIGGGIGSIFGPAGTALGSLLGHGAQSLVKHVTGFGDYMIEQNSLMPGALSPPIINNSKKPSSGVIVRHREYITDITATTGFTTTVYPINAGILATFPWLSQIASSFEEYCIHGMLFEFKSMSSDAVLSTAANTALGTVIMATQYNALNPNFTDKRQMENYEFCNSAKPSESFIHPVECKGSETPVKCLYVRTAPVSTGDLRLYDLGNFTIATQGMQVAGGVIGELWVTFEIEFYKPKLLEGQNLLTDHFILTAVSNTRPLGAALTTEPVPGSAIGTVIDVDGSGLTTLNFPFSIVDGTFMVDYSVRGTATAIVPPAVSFSTNCIVGPNLFENNTIPSQLVRAGTTTSVFMQSFLVTITGPNARIIFGAAGILPAAVVAGDLFIYQINPEIEL